MNLFLTNLHYLMIPFFLQEAVIRMSRVVPTVLFLWVIPFPEVSNSAPAESPVTLQKMPPDSG